MSTIWPKREGKTQLGCSAESRVSARIRGYLENRLVCHTLTLLLCGQSDSIQSADTVSKDSGALLAFLGSFEFPLPRVGQVEVRAQRYLEVSEVSVHKSIILNSQNERYESSAPCPS